MDTFTTEDGRTILTEQCPRCGGRGYIPRYGHNFKGVCFQCNGAAVVSVSQRNTARVLASITAMATGRSRARRARQADPESRAYAAQYAYACGYHD